jgi:hypothetical protein
MRADGRIALAAAVAFAILFLLSAAVVPPLPNPDAPTAEVQRWFVNHRDGVATSAWLLVLGTVPFLVFLAVLRRRLEPAAGWLADLAFAAGLLLAAETAVPLMISLGLALHPDFNPPETVRVLADVERFYMPVATGPVVAIAIAVALASLRLDALPRWVGTASLLYAAYEIFESFTVFGGSTGGFAPGESVNMVGGLAGGVWFVAVGASLMRPYPRGDVPEDHGQAG